MLMELLFGVIFFVLPIVGMFITILATKLREAEEGSAKRPYRQVILWQAPRTPLRVKDSTKAAYFRSRTHAHVPGAWLRDTS